MSYIRDMIFGPDLHFTKPQVRRVFIVMLAITLLSAAWHYGIITSATLVLKTVTAIQEENCHPISQDQDPKQTTELKPAPKFFKEDCKIDWNRNVNEVHNFIRGLSPYPAAFTNLISAEGERLILKIFKAKPFGNNDESSEKINLIPGTIITDGRTHLNIACNEGFISLEEVQLEGKRRLKTEEFLRGFRIDKKWRLS